MKPKSRSSPPKTVDEFLGRLRTDQRIALRRLRASIRAALPNAAECICYGVPAFRVNGKFFVGFGATATHCSFYSGATVRRFQRELANYDTSKGTIRFQPKAPLPSVLVRKLIKARLAERAS